MTALKIIKTFPIIISLMSFGLGFGQMSLVIQGGVSHSELSYHSSLYAIDFYPSTTKNIGFQTGIGLEYFNKKHMLLSFNAGYMRKGHRSTLLHNSQEVDETLDCITLNSIADFKLPLNGKLEPLLSLGLWGSKKVNSGLQYENLSSYNWGVIFGFGIQYSLGGITIGIKSEYYKNYSKILSEKNFIGLSIKDTTYGLVLQLKKKI